MEAVGNECAFKLSTSLRLMTQNTNGIGLIAENIKELAVKELLIEKKIDVMGIQEKNVCWHKMRNKHKMWDRFRGWKECGSCKLAVAYNSSDTIKEKSQYGGTTLITMNILAHRYVGSGIDETKLGRWAWTIYRGKEGKVFHVVLVYRPCTSGKYNSVYLQQMQYLLNHNDVRCPREVILEDLAEHIREYKEKGDSMVVMGDWNKNVRGDKMLDFK